MKAYIRVPVKIVSFLAGNTELLHILGIINNNADNKMSLEDSKPYKTCLKHFIDLRCGDKTTWKGKDLFAW